MLKLPVPMQGYDKYGIWAQDATPTPNLQKALGLKVRLPSVLSTRSLAFGLGQDN